MIIELINRLPALAGSPAFPFTAISLWKALIELIANVCEEVNRRADGGIG